MENNEDTNTNMMDLLPDVMVIKIFEHFENLADLSTLPKVNYRFNVLSEQKCSRNHLLLKDNGIAAYSYEEFQRKMKEEINKCWDLKAVTHAAYRATALPFRNKCMDFIRSLFINVMNRNTKRKIENDDINFLLMANLECFLYSYFKKSADDMSRVVQMAPSAMSIINVTGSPKLFLAAIEKTVNTLQLAIYKGTNLTFAHLNALGKCKNLDTVRLTCNLVVSEEIPEIFHNIQAKEIKLEGDFYCPYVANHFFSETLETFRVYYFTIYGLTNEIITKCTKLRFLYINMEAEKENMQNHHLIDSIIELVNTLKHHQTLRRINILNLNQYIRNSLYEPLSTCLETIAGSEIDISPTCEGHPAIFIELKS